MNLHVLNLMTILAKLKIASVKYRRHKVSYAASLTSSINIPSHWIPLPIADLCAHYVEIIP